MDLFVTTENPRSTFHLDMTPGERDAMNRHVAYWSEKANRGIAIVFEPVMDPDGVYGMGVYKIYTFSISISAPSPFSFP